MVLDEEGHFLFVNRSACRHLGVKDPDSLLGTAWHELWDTDAAVVVRAAIAQAAMGESARFIGMMNNFEGFPVWWDVSVSPIPGIDGHGRRILAVARDVTVGRTAEEKLRLANICLEAIVTATFLRDLRYHVIEATNGSSGLLLARASGSVNLVVTDATMPGCDGPTLAARLRAEWPALPIIFLTGFAGNPLLANETVMMKPYAFPELADLVAERLGR